MAKETGAALLEADGLGPEIWEAYLSNAPRGERQARTCNACRRFVERAGSLAVADIDGELVSAVWTEDAPPAYERASDACRRIVGRARATGVFLSGSAAVGQALTGEWRHLSLRVPAWSHPLLSAEQRAAQLREEHGMLMRGLADFPEDDVRRAAALLASGQLYRAEKHAEMARWLLELHQLLGREDVRGDRSRRRHNLSWGAAALAPPGYCRVRSGLLGSLLEDLQAGLPHSEVARRHAAKMDPEQYLRPQAPPTAGNVREAERVVEALGLGPSLRRRFAHLSDVRAVWRPRPDPAPARAGAGVFSHLRVKGDRAGAPQILGAPPATMTFEKFRREVLPRAERIELLVPATRQPYTAMVTAAVPGSPNLLQWENPVSHYLYVQGSPPRQWMLAPNTWHEVTALVLRPWMWADEEARSHHGRAVLLALKGCRDSGHRGSGGLFPENLRAEYHHIRRTLEAHFEQAEIEGRDAAEVCGLSLVEGDARQRWECRLRVLAGGVSQEYALDRWD